MKSIPDDSFVTREALMRILRKPSPEFDVSSGNKRSSKVRVEIREELPIRQRKHAGAS
jgi:hypothetical protein